MARDTHPFHGVSDFFSEAARMRQLATGRDGYERSPEDTERTHATAWVPATDISTRGDDLVIRIDLAGVEPEDVEITFVGHVLSVDGERHTEEETDGSDSFYIRERFHGRFRRSITLPEHVEADTIEAEFEHGLVEIVVAGGAATGDAQAQRIEVKKTRSAPVRRRLPQAKKRKG